MVLVKLSVSKIAISKKATTTLGITDKMTESGRFVDGADLITAAVVAAKALQEAEQKAYKAGPDATAIMRAKAAACDTALLTLALFVDGIAVNDIEKAEEIIKAAGMEIKTKALPNITTFSVKFAEEQNSVILRRKAVRGASYRFQIAEDLTNEGSWKELKNTTVASFIAGGLASGKRYWFRVALIIGTEQGDWTDAITIVMQ